MSEVAVAESSTYEEMEMKVKQFEMSRNQCYEHLPTRPMGSRKEHRTDSPTDDTTSMEKEIKCMFVMIAVLAVILIGVCAALMVAFVEFSKNRAEIANVANLRKVNDGLIRSNMQNVMILNETLQNFNKQNLQYRMIVNELLPYSSCANVFQRLPSSRSGYYWIRSRDGSNIRVYCGMTRSCGSTTEGWMRIAELDMTDNTAQCPDNLALNTASPRTCRINTTTAGCSSTRYSTNSVEYSKVCGRIRAYQHGTPDTFMKSRTIDDVYVDGVSLTHGSNPRKHIWTFAASPFENVGDNNIGANVCQCIRGGSSSPPTFVNTDYFCDTAVPGSAYSYTLHTDDPLWDGAGCGPNNMCCSFNNPPWFYKQLPQPTTDDIEMRVCRDYMRSNEDIAVEIVEIFVQ